VPTEFGTEVKDLIIMDYNTSNHSKFLLMYHLILVCKYRHKLMITFGDKVKDLVVKYCYKKNIVIETMEIDTTKPDHIHLLLNAPPELAPKDIAVGIKQAVSYYLWKDKKDAQILSRYFWSEHTFFSDGYFICSCGNASASTIQNYIDSQG
jgi:putative transposase